MAKLFTISDPKTHRYLGSIIADRIVSETSTSPNGNNYLLFLDGTKTVAMFPAKNIELKISGLNPIAFPVSK